MSFLRDGHRKEMFCQTYFRTKDAEKSAVKAGYSQKERGWALLQTPEIVSRLMELEADAEHSLVPTEAKIVRELSALAFTNLTDLADIDEYGRVTLKHPLHADPEQWKALSEFYVSPRGGIKLKMYDKRASLELLGRRLGMFKDKTEVTGPDGGPIETQFTVNFIDAKE